jgi:membrane dipeptidase
MKRKLPLTILLLLLTLAAAFFIFTPGLVERKYNRTLHRPPYAVSPKARALHEQLFVADLHADSLLWNRDLLRRGDYGNLDVPRLIEGGIALQAFTIVTKAPRMVNFAADENGIDNVTPLVIAQRWPVKTWTSLTERALYQARKLKDLSHRSGGSLVIIQSASDLSSYLQMRTNDRRVVAAFLGVEGAHALDGRLENLDLLFDAGVRMMAPTHYFDNEFGGSAQGLNKGGLTEKGRELIRRMEQRRMIVDLAHASDATISDVVRMATRPVIVSHTGVKGTCNNPRNLSDEQLKSIAVTGGVIGIGYWETATCGDDAQSIARAIHYTADLIGIEHIALGSDFDGAVATAFDTTGVVQVTDALLAQGLTEDQIKMVMGGNVLRLLTQTLPQTTP